MMNYIAMLAVALFATAPSPGDMPPLGGWMSAPTGIPIPSPAAGGRQAAPPIRLVLVDSLPHDEARALVIRAGTGISRVLVTEQTTPSDLAIALAVLKRSHRETPARSRGEMRAFIRSVPERDTASTARAATHLARLGAQAPSMVDGVGMVRNILLAGHPDS
jgi:hypothetical protein